MSDIEDLDERIRASKYLDDRVDHQDHYLALVEIRDLKTRNAELEQKSERQATNIGALYRQRRAAEKRVTELEAALRKIDSDNLSGRTEAKMIARDALRKEEVS